MNLVDRAKNIIITPKTEWVTIAGEEPNIGQIFTGYVLPLALIPAVASVIGWGVIGSGVFGGSIIFGVAQGVIQLVLAFASVYIAAFVIDILAPNFGSQKNLGRAVQLVAYSFTPAWVGGVLNIIPLLGWLGGLFGLYGLYLLYVGFPHVMKTPEDKVIVYLIVSIIVIFVVWGVLTAILSGIVFAILGLGVLGAGAGM
ncbi:MAG: YIP1 family protein [Ignavibacteria bacterium]|nr:YIP1 family protein [Ignavibacteria bacterium]